MTVSGTTTTINSTVSTLVDPIFELGTDTDGHPGSDDNKDRGLLHYYSGSTHPFMGWDESRGLTLYHSHCYPWEPLDGTQVYDSIRTGNIKINDGFSIGTPTDSRSQLFLGLSLSHKEMYIAGMRRWNSNRFSDLDVNGYFFRWSGHISHRIQYSQLVVLMANLLI